MAKMQHNQTLLIKVVEVKKNVKTFPSQQGTKTRHDIHMIDGAGNKYKAEFLTIGAYDESAFPINKEGEYVWQHVRCIRDNDAGFEIVPTEPPGEKELVYAPSGSVNHKETIPNQGTQLPQPRMPNISGSPVAFGYAYAKDIIVEQLKGLSDTDKFAIGTSTLSKMIGDLGDELTDRMVKKALEVSK